MSSPQRSSVERESLHVVGGRGECRHTLRKTFERWHLLSLDAPTVAVTWTLFIAWCAGVHTAIADPAAMFVAVWILYAADRLLDARPLANGTKLVDLTDMEERHRFHYRHRRRFLPCLAAGTIPLAILLHAIPNGVLHLYIILAALLSGWLVLVHALPAAGSRRLPKELAVAVFFPAAVFIPTVARAPWLRLNLLPGAFLFACVCFLNCTFLYAWEHPDDLSRAHPSTRFAAHHLREISIAVVLACIVMLAVPATVTRMPHRAASGLVHPDLLAWAVLLSTSLLLLLHSLRHRITPLQLRALADFVLLTPAALAAGVYLVSAYK